MSTTSRKKRNMGLLSASASELDRPPRGRLSPAAEVDLQTRSGAPLSLRCPARYLGGFWQSTWYCALLSAARQVTFSRGRKMLRTRGNLAKSFIRAAILRSGVSHELSIGVISFRILVERAVRHHVPSSRIPGIVLPERKYSTWPEGVPGPDEGLLLDLQAECDEIHRCSCAEHLECRRAERQGRNRSAQTHNSALQHEKRVAKCPSQSRFRAQNLEQNRCGRAGSAPEIQQATWDRANLVKTLRELFHSAARNYSRSAEYGQRFTELAVV